MIYIIGHNDNISKTINTLITNVSHIYKYIDTSTLHILNEDDIILKMDKYINEFVGQYAIIHYTHPQTFYGFCHYRRIINYIDVDFNNIIKNNSVQIFTCSFHFFKKYMELTLQENNVEYELMHTYFVHQFGLKYIYDEFCEFMHTQPDFLQERFKNSMKINNMVDINDKENTLYMLAREIYATTYKNAFDMTNFIISFIKFVFDKHNCKTIEDFENYMNNNLYNIVDLNSICEEYNWFKNYSEHHIRAYGFFIEFLIGLYFYSNTSSIYTRLYPAQWITVE